MSNNIENLFTQYYQILRAYALRYVQNQDAAEDIVQDVFFELWLRRNEIDFDLPMKAYLFKSVLNKSRNYIYDKRVKDKISFDSDPVHRRLLTIVRRLSGRFPTIERFGSGNKNLCRISARAMPPYIHHESFPQFEKQRHCLATGDKH